MELPDAKRARKRQVSPTDFSPEICLEVLDWLQLEDLLTCRRVCKDWDRMILHLLSSKSRHWGDVVLERDGFYSFQKLVEDVAENNPAASIGLLNYECDLRRGRLELTNLFHQGIPVIDLHLKCYYNIEWELMLDNCGFMNTLKSLTLESRMFDQVDGFQKMLQCCPQLERLRWVCGVADRQYLPSSPVPILHHTLESLAIERLYELGPDERTWDAFKLVRFPQIRQLTYREETIERRMDSLISSSLESLTLDVHIYHLPELLELMKENQIHLQKLVLKTGYDQDDQLYYPDFRYFSTLKELYLNARHLKRDTLIPLLSGMNCQLHTLRVSHLDRCLSSASLDGLDVIIDMFPNLQVLGFEKFAINSDKLRVLATVFKRHPTITKLKCFELCYSKFRIDRLLEFVREVGKLVRHFKVDILESDIESLAALNMNTFIVHRYSDDPIPPINEDFLDAIEGSAKLDFLDINTLVTVEIWS